MAWRLTPNQWPNGRKYWTVENRERRLFICGKKGNPSKYYDREQAEAARDEMKRQEKE